VRKCPCLHHTLPTLVPKRDKSAGEGRRGLNPWGVIVVVQDGRPSKEEEEERTERE